MTQPVPLPAVVVLDSARCQQLRAQAHALHPVVTIAGKGLSTTVLAEIERALHAHQLIKVKLRGRERAERAMLATTICTQMGCALVQHVGQVLVLWRPATLATP